jgi:hypothetical protein
LEAFGGYMAKVKDKENVEEEVDEEKHCKYSIETLPRESQMIFSCKKCDVDADIKNTHCMFGALKSLSEEFNIDSIILSHYIEKRYHGPMMKILNEMNDLIGEMDRMSYRNPFNESFEQEASLEKAQVKQQKHVCDNCDINPQNIIPPLKNHFMKDIGEFYLQLLQVTQLIKGGKQPRTCDKCIEATENDMVYLFNELEDLRALILYYGYKIVI